MHSELYTKLAGGRWVLAILPPARRAHHRNAVDILGLPGARRFFEERYLRNFSITPREWTDPVHGEIDFAPSIASGTEAIHRARGIFEGYRFFPRNPLRAKPQKESVDKRGSSPL
jgi:hypothetical protein